MSPRSRWPLQVDRDASLERLAKTKFDLVVIGGGITGAGVALDAVSRGLSVALVEKGDFASGTSSKSSKLIHGGLRYLKQLQFRVTLESLREREILLRLAPHLVRVLPFVLPFSRKRLAGAQLAVGLSLYDRMARSPRGRLHHRLTRNEVVEHLPHLDRGIVGGGFEFFDAHADDCRLVMHVLKKAVFFGAVAVNHLRCDEIRSSPRHVTSEVICTDVFTGSIVRIHGKRVVNATGVWCDEVRRSVKADAKPLLRPSKGIHIVIDGARLPLDCGVAIPKISSGHHLLIVPYGDRLIVGTTDTPYDGDLDKPLADEKEIAILIDGVNEYFPSVRLTQRDVLTSYAGLRPLLIDPKGRSTAAASREFTIESLDGVVTVTGGKLTTYRQMAKKVVNTIAKGTRCRTRSIDLFATRVRPDGVPDDVGVHLLEWYGSEGETIARRSGARDRLTAALPYTFAEVDYLVQCEMASSTLDIVDRRLRLSLTDPAAAGGIAPLVNQRLGELLGWSREQHRRDLERFRASRT